MSDIFISYAREDRDTAQRLAEALEAQGWSVWWDTRLKAGEVFDEVIGRELAAARCVIVLWSKISVQRNWVRVEAEEGLKRRILVPVGIENVQPPLAFRRVQTGDLISWKGRPAHPGFKKLMTDVTGIIGLPPSPLPPDEEREHEPAPPTPNNGSKGKKTESKLDQFVATIKEYFTTIAEWRRRKWHLAMAAGFALLVIGGVAYFLYEPPHEPPQLPPDPSPEQEKSRRTPVEPPPPPEPVEPQPQTFETNTHGVIGEVTDFSMAGKSVRLSIRIFSKDDDLIDDGTTGIRRRPPPDLCITPQGATLVDEQTGKEWKAASSSHNYDCSYYPPKTNQMYWMSFQIGQDLQTTFTVLIPGLAKPLKGLKPR
jgi:hypothetical protein